MARLPTPGGDDNQWGNILNDYLSQAHNDDGTAKDATDSSKGVVQLSGDLGGTADNPTVPGLAAKAGQTDVDALDTRVDALEDEIVPHVVYDPSKDGLSGLEQVTMTVDGAQTLELSIEAGRLRGSRSQATGGNMRSFVLVDGTEWEDSEIEVVLWNPSIFGSTGATDRPQMGTVHRVSSSNGKRWGFVVWWNIFIFGPDVWNLAMWGANLDGTGFSNASGLQQATTNWQDRVSRAFGANRFNFGDWVQDHFLGVKEVEKLRWLTSGDQVNITELVDSTRTVTGVSRTNGSANITFPANVLLPQDVGKRISGTGIPAGATIASVTSATAGTISANATATSSSNATVSETVGNPTTLNGDNQQFNSVDVRLGNIQLIAANQTAPALRVNAPHHVRPTAAHKRFFPIRLSSRLVGNRLQARLARLEDQLPEWNDPVRVATIDLVAPANLPAGFVDAGITDIPSGPGRCGIVFAHAVNPHFMEAGIFKARKL